MPLTMHSTGSRRKAAVSSLLMSALLASALILGGCTEQQTRPHTRRHVHNVPIPPKAPRRAKPEKLEPDTKQPAVYQRGEASFYARRFDGQLTANGEHFSSNRLTAAHRSLPLGTRVRVTNVDNGRSVTVRINDRGPYADGRIIDLSRRAAKRLGIIDDGTAEVTLRVLHWPKEASQ